MHAYGKRLLACLLVAMCSVVLTMTTVLAADVGVVKVGYTGPFTGPAAEFGTNGWRGIQLALEDINAKGIMIKGKKHVIEIIRYDSVCQPTDAVSNVKKLILQDKVSAILGDHCSSCCVAVVPLCDEAKIPGITFECAADAVTKPGSEYYFRIRAPVGLIAPLFGPSLLQKLKPRSMSYLVINDDYGTGLVDGLKKVMAPLGVKTTLVDTFERGNTDFMVNMAKIKMEKPDLVFFAGTATEGAMILKQAKEAGVTKTVKFVGAEEMGEMEFLEQAGASVVEGVYAYTLWKSVPAEFTKRIRDKFDAPVHYVQVFGYDAMKVLAAAIESAQSTKSEDIKNALKKTNYKGLTAQISFSNFDGYTNQLKVAPYLMQWKNGQRTIVD